MEKGSCSRNSRYNKRAEVASGLDSVVGSVSLLNVSSDGSNRNLREAVNAEASSSRSKRYQFRNQNRHPEIVSEEEDEDDDNDDGDDEEYVINRRGSNSAQKKINPNKRLRNHGRRKITLRARNSRGLMIQETQKRSILSWLIDSGTVHLNTKVYYVDWTSKRSYGKITREGIFCNCCQTTITVSEFVAHSGSKTELPFQNIFTDRNISLLQCQMKAWNKLREKCRHNRPIINYKGDPNDDTCGVCGDGGNLMCCDICPSTFHHNCLGFKVVPQGDWYCPLSVCKYCRLVVFRSNGLLLTCRQCGVKFHQVCIPEEEATSTFDHNGSPFCRNSCKQLFQQLQNLVGIKIKLESGISWSLIRCFDSDLATYGNGLYQRMQYNSTLAATLAVMEECFDPIIDCRTGINMLRNIICNHGSNICRLNFSGFYTAVLERGDEIISAASIRIHGTRLAEMPFVGTRNKYRSQGMCHRLLNAIESTFRIFGIEKIIIPSVSDRVNKWINSYGFKHIEEPLKQQMRTMNLLTFPETVQLQKVLLMNRVNDSGNRAAAAVPAPASAAAAAAAAAAPAPAPAPAPAAAGDTELRVNDRLLVPRPFDLNQPPEEDECANNGLHCAKCRPTYGFFIVLNIHDGTIGYQRVQVRH